jgi:hypothetical protein
MTTAPYLAGKLHRDRTDPAGGPVNQDRLARDEACVVDEPLPRGQSGDRKSRGNDGVVASGKACEVARLYRGVLG